MKSELPEPSIDELCDRAVEEGKKRTRLRMRVAAAHVAVVAAGLVAIQIEATKHSGNVLFFCVLISNLMLAGLTVIVPTLRHKSSEKLSGMQDGAIVGPLLEAKDAHAESHVKAQFKETLRPLLCNLSEEHACLFSPRHIRSLNKDVEFCGAWKWGAKHEVEYALSALSALKLVGDETSLPHLEKALRTVKQPEVLRAIEECLPLVRERAQIGRQTLLRASAGPEGALLRPLEGSATAAEQELLRAVRHTDHKWTQAVSNSGGKTEDVEQA
jgi:hypothetical protein